MKIWNRNHRNASTSSTRPAPVELEHVHEAIAAARASTAVLGLGNRGEVESIDLDASHVLVAGGAGSGKSVLIRSMIGQHLAHGAEVVVLDPGKRTYRWAEVHPDVTAAVGADDIHHQLVRVAQLLEEREELPSGALRAVRRLVLVVEERNTIVEILRKFWAEARMPWSSKESPAVKALFKLEAADPKMRIHLVTSSYRAPVLNANRPAYATRIVSERLSESAWHAIAPGVSRPLRGRTGRPGRFTVVTPGGAVALRALSLTHEEALHLPAALIAAERRTWGGAA
ncbi:FtsK/SpoIIIE domain-containing protein [Pseudoxanthomonas sp. UTMC 1351]|uniref:type IV secretory system conjugative DNA transfer family protein n=1 Tax=Pseudoxanthomonas sp. UTMC 1351 TaxID=2695853 RepID=UPI0034CE90A4